MVGGRNIDLVVWAYLQHYDIPTPYLDWSESFYVALFFSLFDGIDTIKKLSIGDPTSWRKKLTQVNSAIFTLDLTFSKLIGIFLKILFSKHSFMFI